MFEKKEKNKLGKFRFQNSSFKRQLQSAREYKRTTRKVPETKLEGLFLKFKGIPLKYKLSTLLVLVLFLYIALIPNFLFIKNIEIKGLNANEASMTNIEAKNYLTTYQLFGQKNILLFSKKNLTNHLLLKEASILKIDSITRKFPHSIIIQAQPKYEKFLITTPQFQYILTNDQVFLRKLAYLASTSTTTLVSIFLEKPEEFTIHSEFLNFELLNFIDMTYKLLQDDVKTSVRNFNLTEALSSEVTVKTNQGYSIFFDSNLKLGLSIQRLNLILSEIPQNEFSQLIYVDLRLPSRAFVCFKNSL